MTTNPFELVWWAIDGDVMVVVVGVLAVAIIAAVVVFGGGWS
jgi:hypothetical protein